VRDSVASGVQVAQASGAHDLLVSVRTAYVAGMDTLLWVSAAIAVIGAVIAVRRLPGVVAAGSAAADPAESEHDPVAQPELAG
jgi:MFS transporter, DHA2 family, multidrug resistance protein